MPDRPFHFAQRICTVGAVSGLLPDPIGSSSQRFAALQLRGAAGPLTAQVRWPGAPGAGAPPPPLLLYFGDAARPAPAVAPTLCAQAGVVVLAPRCRALHDAFWPAFCDAAAALEWAADHAAELGADGGRLLVAGHWRAARLAAALVIHARDHGWPRLMRQVLICPRLRASPTGGGGNGSYVAPPLVACAGLAPATFLLPRGSSPPDDGARYARRLALAGVAVEELHITGAPERGVEDLARLLRPHLACRDVDLDVARSSSE
jgi:acetyl esterase